MKSIIFATTNENKIREVREILGLDIQGIKLDVKEIQTLDPEEAIKNKAFVAYSQLRKPVLVEDTSLFFDAWRGLPGVFIDYFLESVGIKGILKMLANEKNRQAIAMVLIGIFNGKNYKIYKGQILGTITKKPIGESGFGWDPIFIPKGYNKTFAEMSSKEKNKISMRKIALIKLKKEIKSVLE